MFVSFWVFQTIRKIMQVSRKDIHSIYVIQMGKV